MPVKVRVEFAIIVIFNLDVRVTPRRKSAGKGVKLIAVFHDSLTLLTKRKYVCIY